MSDVVLNFTLDEFGVRLAKVRAVMEHHELDLLIVHDPSNMSWLTGYDGWSTCLSVLSSVIPANPSGSAVDRMPTAHAALCICIAKT